MSRNSLLLKSLLLKSLLLQSKVKLIHENIKKLKQT